MTEKEAVHEILSKALDADERGDKEEAIVHYTNAVERILRISDPEVKQKLNKYAVQALDRAEELRGIQSPSHRPPASEQRVQPSSTNVRSEGSWSIAIELNAIFCEFFC